MLSRDCVFKSLLVISLVCLTAAQTQAGAAAADYLLRPAQAAKIGQVPALIVTDSSGALRWQVPVALWYWSNNELGRFAYPVGVSPDKPLAVKGKLIFVGFGLTREGWDDYRNQRIDGCVAVMYTGAPRLNPGDSQVKATDPQAWLRLIHEKVANAQTHGAVGVWIEFNPSAEADTSGTDLLPKSMPGLWHLSVDGQLPLPVFSVGADTLGVIVGLSSELFKGNITAGDAALSYLLNEAEKEGEGLGPLPLALTGDLTWSGAQLDKCVGEHCTVWYQPESPAARDSASLVKACDRMVDDLSSLLSAQSQERTTVLLFGDWRSKFYTLGHIGWGVAEGNRMASVYEGGKDKATLIHELCHVVSSRLGHPPACFEEGLGQLAGDTLGALESVTRGRIPADDTTAAYLREGKLWTLPQLLAIPGFGTEESNSLVAYPEAASFCAYLIRQIGFDGFMKLYQTLGQGDPQAASKELEKAVGRPIDQIETEWHAYLRGSD